MPAVLRWFSPVCDIFGIEGKDMHIPEHLTIPIESVPFDQLFQKWRWLLKTTYTPVMMTAFGDLFLLLPLN